MILSFNPTVDNGANGDTYGMPNEFKELSLIIKYINVITTPIIPIKLAPNINSILYHLIPFIISGSVNNRADNAVIAITIIIIGETIPALTAASPNIRAPTVDKALDVKDGLLKSHSLNISKENAIKRASKKAGNGTLDLCEAKLTSNSVGSIS